MGLGACVGNRRCPCILADGVLACGCRCSSVPSLLPGWLAVGGLLAPVGLLLVALGSVCRLGSALAFGGVRLGAAMGRLLPWGHVADGCCRLLVTVLWMFGCVRCVWPRWNDSGVITCV